MEIAIIGAGRIGANVARQLAGAGHALRLSFARDLAALEQLADELGAAATTPAEAVAAYPLLSRSAGGLGLEGRAPVRPRLRAHQRAPDPEFLDQRRDPWPRPPGITCRRRHAPSSTRSIRSRWATPPKASMRC